MHQYCVQHQKNTVKKTVITTAPLSSLKEITGKDLVVGKTHVGCFIKLTITSANQVIAVQITAKDTQNKVVTLSLYNFPFKGKTYEDYFYNGVVLLVKEPFYKLTASGQIGIRVDDPDDVEFGKALKNNSIQDKKAEGRDLVKKAQYIEAYCLYDQILKELPNDKDKCTIFINKAIVCSHLNLKQQYKQNIEDALKIDPTNQKANFHFIKADLLSTETKTTQKYSNVKKNIKQNSYLSEQSKKDLYEFVSFNQTYQKAETIDWYRAIKTQNLAEFWSPKIKVDKSPFGRGLFATHKILPGEILIIEKALAYNKFQFVQQLTNQTQTRSIMHGSSSDDFVTRILPLFKRSPQFQKKLYYLSSKQYPGEKINDKNRPKDRNQIESIFSSNAFNDYQLTNIFNQRKNYDLLNIYNLIYQKISLLNHQCQNNCDRFYIGTTGIVYAVREINPGQEIFIYYMHPENIKERQQALKHWGIDYCRCILCREQRGEKIDKKQGQSFSKYYYQSTYQQLPKASLSWQAISNKIYGLFLVQNIYKESINHPLGDQILHHMFRLNPLQLQDLKNTFK